MTANKRSLIEKRIQGVFDSLDTNNFAVLGRKDEPMWDGPLIGIAAGDDPYYDFLKEHIGPFHWTPAEAFAEKYGEAPEPSDLCVISMAFVQTARTMEMQKQATVGSCDEWLVSRGEWEPMIEGFCRKLEGAFEEDGLRIVCPDLLPSLIWLDSDTSGLASNWSQRHTAYAAGQGTFGLSDGFITRKGIGVRFTSVIVEMDLPADGRVSEDPYGWCDRCGCCIGRCPAGAISLENGHDKNTCDKYVDYGLEQLWPEHLEPKYDIYGCGLCQGGVPCSNHPPKSGEIKYRRIERSDNPQLAQLVRAGLKGYGLDIPGTAYFDPQLDEFYEYYTAEPEKRSYFVAYNGHGRIIGGIGVDAFAGVAGCAELQKLYVAEEYRGQGIARHLMGMFEDEARRLGYSRAYIETHSKLQEAKHLYERSGFTLIDRPQFAVHDTMDTFFIKDL